MRYVTGSAPGWPYAIGKPERDALAPQIVALASRLGFDLPEDSIRGVELMGHADAISIELDEGATGSAGRHYIEYPMERRSNEGDPVVLKGDVAHRLLDYLHTQRWRQERRRTTKGLPNSLMERHLDGDALTRWTRSMALQSAGRIRKLSSVPDQFREIVHTCRAELRTDSGTVRMEGDAIVLPFMLPEVLTGARILWLGELMSFPPCGDSALDEEIGRLMIMGIEASKGNSAVPAHTTIRLGMQRQAPLLAGEDSDWRRLRAIRPFMMGMEPDYLVPDIERGAAAYHAQCDEALGARTTLPIALVRDGAT